MSVVEREPRSYGWQSLCILSRAIGGASYPGSQHVTTASIDPGQQSPQDRGALDH